MADRRMLWGILAAALISGTILPGCPNGTTGKNDTWSDVTSIDQLDGTWRGTYDETKTIQEIIPGNPIGIDFGDTSVTINADITVTIDSNAKRASASTTTTMTFSGSGLSETTWAMLKMFLAGEESIITDDDKHSITMTENEYEEDIDEEDPSIRELQINQDGTKMRLPEDLEDGVPEMTLFRQ